MTDHTRLCSDRHSNSKIAYRNHGLPLVATRTTQTNSQMTEYLSTDFSNNFPVSFRVFGMSKCLKPTIDKINALGYDGVSALIISPEKLPSPTDEDLMVIILADESKDTDMTIAKSFYQAGVLTLIISTSPITSETSFCDAQTISDIKSMYTKVKCILDILTKDSYICIAFSDIAYALRNSGFFKIIETAAKEGEKRIADALSEIESDLSGDEKVSFDRIIISIYFNSGIQPPLSMNEMKPLSDFISSHPEGINAIWGLSHDDRMPSDKIRLTAIVSGKDLKL